MFGAHFQLNEQTMSIVEEIGRYMPGGFFIYKVAQPEELLYANQAVFNIFGCENLGSLRLSPDLPLRECCTRRITG